MIEAKILADSITDGGSRLITWQWTYPRAIHAEIMTHRALSRNLASSRAIPAKRMRQNIIEKPFIPIHWGKNQAGMQALAEIEDTKVAEDWWNRGLNMMYQHHEEGEKLGLHKQIVNRVIEPWMLAVGIISMTDHANLFWQRTHKDAEPHFQKLAKLAQEIFYDHMPTYLAPGEWHLPLVYESDRKEVDIKTLIKLSSGRCARVSYLTHEGKRDLQEDIDLHDKLLKLDLVDPMHASPFEHQAMAVGGRQRFGNFEGWKQYRKFFNHENGPNTDNRCERCGCWDRHVNTCPLK